MCLSTFCRAFAPRDLNLSQHRLKGCFSKGGLCSGVLPKAGFVRALLNLWFAKPMVCMRVAFHENDGDRENDENDEDNSDSYRQGVECWTGGNHGNH